jgi:hypothetical protein
MNRDLPSISINERVVFTSRLPAEEGGAGEGVGPGVGHHKIPFSKNNYANNYYGKYFFVSKNWISGSSRQIFSNFTFSVQFCVPWKIVAEKTKKITSKY